MSARPWRKHRQWTPRRVRKYLAQPTLYRILSDDPNSSHSEVCIVSASARSVLWNGMHLTLGHQQLLMLEADACWRRVSSTHRWRRRGWHGKLNRHYLAAYGRTLSSVRRLGVASEEAARAFRLFSGTLESAQ